MAIPPRPYHHSHTMVIPWQVHGLTMAIPWPYHGHTMVILWSYHGQQVAIPWPCHGHNRANLWPEHGQSMAISHHDPTRLPAGIQLPSCCHPIATLLPCRCGPIAIPVPSRGDVMAKGWPWNGGRKQDGDGMGTAWQQHVKGEGYGTPPKLNTCSQVSRSQPRSRCVAEHGGPAPRTIDMRTQAWYMDRLERPHPHLATVLNPHHCAAWEGAVGAPRGPGGGRRFPGRPRLRAGA